MLDFIYDASAKKLLLALIAIAAIILVVANLLFISLLIAASLLLSYIVGWLKIKAIGLELVTFITVLSSVAYGPLAGAVIGLALIIFHIAIPQYAGAYIVWVIPEYAFAAVLAGALSGSIASIGITVTLILNAINVFLTFLVYKENLGKYLPYAFTNVIFNFIFFTQGGEFVLGLLK